MFERLKMCAKGTGNEAAAVSCLSSVVFCQSNNQTLKHSNNVVQTIKQPNNFLRGFTIVELLMVVGIIIILMGVVTTAASQSIRASRSRRADALFSLVKAGMNAYYARYDQWPGSIGSQIANGSITPNGDKDHPDVYVLSGTEVRSCVKALVDETKNGTPVMDISGLYVSRFQGELSGSRVRKATGMDFMSAIHGTRSSQKKMKTAEMYYGYPDSSTGYFLRFGMVYSIPTDQFSVMSQKDAENMKK